MLLLRASFPPQIELSSEEDASKFKIKKKEDRQVNPCASNFRAMAMGGLDGIVQEVGGFKLSTPMPTAHLSFSTPRLSEEAKFEEESV